MKVESMKRIIAVFIALVLVVSAFVPGAETFAQGVGQAESTTPAAISIEPSAGMVAATDGINEGTPGGRFIAAEVSGTHLENDGNPWVSSATPGMTLHGWDWESRNIGGIWGSGGAPDAGTGVSFVFTGTDIDLHVLRMDGTNPSVEVTIAVSDSSTRTYNFLWPDNIFGTTPAGETIVHSFEDLPNGTHTLTVNKTGSGYIAIPGFTVFGEDSGNGGSDGPSDNDVLQIEGDFYGVYWDDVIDSPGTFRLVGYAKGNEAIATSLFDRTWGSGSTEHWGFVNISSAGDNWVRIESTPTELLVGQPWTFSVDGLDGGIIFLADLALERLDDSGSRMARSGDEWTMEVDLIATLPNRLITVPGPPIGDTIYDADVREFADTVPFAVADVWIDDSGNNGGGFTYTPGQRTDYVLRFEVPATGSWDTRTTHTFQFPVGEVFTVYASVATVTEFTTGGTGPDNRALAARVQFAWNDLPNNHVWLTDQWQTISGTFTGDGEWRQVLFLSAQNYTGGAAHFYIADIVIVDEQGNIVFHDDFTAATPDTWARQENATTSIVAFPEGDGNGNNGDDQWIARYTLSASGGWNDIMRVDVSGLDAGEHIFTASFRTSAEFSGGTQVGIRSAFNDSNHETHWATDQWQEFSRTIIVDASGSVRLMIAGDGNNTSGPAHVDISNWTLTRVMNNEVVFETDFSDPTRRLYWIDNSGGTLEYLQISGGTDPGAGPQSDYALRLDHGYDNAIWWGGDPTPGDSPLFPAGNYRLSAWVKGNAAIPWVALAGGLPAPSWNAWTSVLAIEGNESEWTFISTDVSSLFNIANPGRLLIQMPAPPNAGESVFLADFRLERRDGDNWVVEYDFTDELTRPYRITAPGAGYVDNPAMHQHVRYVPIAEANAWPDGGATRDTFWVRGGNLYGFRAIGGIADPIVDGGIHVAPNNTGWWRSNGVPPGGAYGAMHDLRLTVPSDGSGYYALRLLRRLPENGAIAPVSFEFDFEGTGIELGVSSNWTGATIDVRIIPRGANPGDYIASATLTHRYNTGLGQVETLTAPELMYFPPGEYTLRGTITNHPDRGNDIDMALVNFIVHDESAMDARMAIVAEPTDTEMMDGADRTISVDAEMRGVGSAAIQVITYQWYEVDGITHTAIPSATSSTLDLSGLLPGTHRFAVVVSGTANGIDVESVTSRVAVVTVNDSSITREFFISNTGSNANPGTEALPWATVAHVQTFINSGQARPGDSFLFQRGGVWINGDVQGDNTSFLQITRGGMDGAFITLGAYGDLNEPKPILNGSGRHNTIYFENVEYVRVRDMRIMNDSTTDGIPQRNRRGIFIGAWPDSSPSNNGDRWFRGFEFINIEITQVQGWVRHVYGMNDSHRNNPIMGMTNLPANVRNNIGGNWWGSAAMEFNAGREDAAANPGAGFADVLIEGSYFFDFGAYGIRAAGDAHSVHQPLSHPDAMGFIDNFWMRNSVMRNTGQDSFNVLGGSVEFSAFYDNALYYVLNPQVLGGPQWEWTCIAYVSDGSIHQFNEYTRAWYDGDSMAIDADLGSIGTVLIQFNYSHDMDGGFWMQWPTVNDRQNGPGWGNEGPMMDAVIMRYNIIVNDGGYWGYQAPGARTGNMHVFEFGDPNALVYNNTIFKNNGFWIGISNNMPRVGHPFTDYGQRNPAGAGVHFVNNLFVSHNVGGLSGTAVPSVSWPGITLEADTIAPPPSFPDDAAFGVTGARVVGVERRGRAANYNGSSIVGGLSLGEIYFYNNVFWGTDHNDDPIPMGAPDPHGLFIDPVFLGIGGSPATGAGGVGEVVTGDMPIAPGFYTAKWNELVESNLGWNSMTTAQQRVSLNRTLINFIGTEAILTDSQAVQDGLRYLASPFMIAHDSPLVGAGIIVDYAFARALLPNMRDDLFNFGKGFDFFGNPVPSGTAPTIGAHEPRFGVPAVRAEVPEIELLDEDKTAIRIANIAGFAHDLEYMITPGDGQWHVYNPATGITGLVALTTYSIQVRYIGVADALPSRGSNEVTTARRGLSSSVPMLGETVASAGNVYSFYGVGFEVNVTANGTLTVVMGSETVTINVTAGNTYYFDIPGVDANGSQSVTISGTAGIGSVVGYEIMIPATPLFTVDPNNSLNVSISNLSDFDTARFGPLQVSLNGGAWFVYTDRIEGMMFGMTNATFVVRHMGTNFYILSAESAPSLPHTPEVPAVELPAPHNVALPPAPVRIINAINNDGADAYNFVTWHGWGPIPAGRNEYGDVGMLSGGTGSSYVVNFRGTAIEKMAHLQYNHGEFAVVLNGELLGYFDQRRLGNPAPGHPRGLNFRIDGLPYGDHVLEVFVIGGTWAQVNAIVIYGQHVVPAEPVLNISGNIAHITNMQDYEDQSLHTDLDGTLPWVFGVLQYSIDGGDTWANYDAGAGIALNDPSDEVLVRYAGTNRPISATGPYRLANFTHSLPSGTILEVAPRISNQPTSEIVSVSGNATFTVTATGTPMPTFQWQVNAGSGWTALAGEESATLTLTGVTANMDGNQYRVVVTNSMGNVTSNVATLTVIDIGVDKTELAALVALAELLVQSNYTPDTWSDLADALRDARNVLGDATATADDVLDAIADLQAAMDSLQTVAGAISVTGVTIQGGNFEINVGAARQLVAVITPSGATNQNVIWESANANIARVHPTTGLLTAVTPGVVVITVTTEDGDFTANITVTVRRAPAPPEDTPTRPRPTDPVDPPATDPVIDETIIITASEQNEATETREDIVLDLGDVTITIPGELVDTWVNEDDEAEDVHVYVTLDQTSLPAELNIDLTREDGTLVEIAEGAPIVVDVNLSVADDINHNRIVAVLEDGTLVGGSYDPETGVFTFETEITGHFTINYVESLQRIHMNINSMIITDYGQERTVEMDVMPFLQNGRTMVPLRFVAETLGASVHWSYDEYQIVTIVLDGQVLQFAIGEYLPGMDVPAQLIGGRTYVPLRFIAEFFGAVVSWDAETGGIEILRMAPPRREDEE